MMSRIRAWLLGLAVVAVVSQVVATKSAIWAAEASTYPIVESARTSGVILNNGSEHAVVEAVFPESDSFNSCEVDDSLWEKNLPSGATFFASGYTADITAAAGMAHDPDKSGASVGQIPRLTQPAADNDFEIETRFNSTLANDGQQQGFLIEQDADDFVSIAAKREGGKLKLRVYSFSGGVASWESGATILEGSPMYLRVERTGNRWQVTYSFDGFDYLDGGTFTHTLAVSWISLFAASSGADEHTAVIDYFRNRDSAVNPADTVAMTFGRVVADLDPVDPSNVGTVIGAPQIPTPGNPTCGTPLSLTASPNPGWAFDRWEGNFGVGEDELLVREFGFGERVTAYFRQEAYRLETYTVSDGEDPDTGGTVESSPEKPYYVYGDIVQTAAIPNPGWQFSGWSGDISSTNATEVLTMTGDASITAAFVQMKYSVSVAIVADGGTDASDNDVEVSPAVKNPPGYVYGESATFTALPDEGWTLAGWSGDLSSTALTETLILTGNAYVTATFALVHYEVLTETVNMAGVGVDGARVALTPPADAAGYVFGEKIAAEAFPPADWVFVRWEGALDGSENPASFIVTDNANIRAVFARPDDDDIFRLVIEIVGAGSVSRSPDKSGYAANEQVKLTAVPGTSWIFDRWENDIPPGNRSTAEIALTMDGDKIVTVFFLERPSLADIYLPHIVRN